MVLVFVCRHAVECVCFVCVFVCVRLTDRGTRTQEQFTEVILILFTLCVAFPCITRRNASNISVHFPLTSRFTRSHCETLGSVLHSLGNEIEIKITEFRAIKVWRARFSYPPAYTAKVAYYCQCLHIKAI